MRINFRDNYRESLFAHTHTHTAVMRVDFNLEELCLEKLSRWLKSGEKVDRLPLPARLKDKVKQFINE